MVMSKLVLIPLQRDHSMVKSSLTETQLNYFVFGDDGALI